MINENRVIWKPISRRLFLLPVGIFLSICIALTSLQQPLLAAITLTNNSSPQDRARLYTYNQVANQCVRSVMLYTIKTPPGNGETTPGLGGFGFSVGDSKKQTHGENAWFRDDESVGYVYQDGSIQKISCDKLFQAALPLWGFSSGQELLTAMGYTYDAGATQWSLPADKQSADAQSAAFLSAIGDPFYVKSLALNDNASQHLLYIAAFTASCDAKQQGPYPGTNASYKTWADDAKKTDWTKIKIVEGNEPEEYIYSFTPTTTSMWAGQTSTIEATATIWSYPKEQKSATLKCSELPALISKTAPGLVDWNEKNPEDAIEDSTTQVDPDNPEGEDQSSCNIDGIGWIVCPVMTFLAWVSDEAYGLIENFLRVPAAIVADTSGTHTAWKVLRNISNIAFVIVFLIIIYSQMTGMLIGSYGVKKMLPKLIIAAILVNLSFIVCQLAVDVSQLLGAGLTGFFNSMIDSLLLPSNGIGTTWEGVVGGGLLIAGLAGGATVAALAISFPVILAVLLSVLITVLILMGRQAAIVILVVLSPLAFVAYILPNTEQWFKKWLKMFWGILMVYPIVALLYGGGKLASRIIQNVAAESDMTLLSITALGVAALPLIMTPTILKSAMNATGTLGAKLSGMSGKANARVGNKMKTRSIAGRGISSALENRARNRARKQDAFLAKHGTKGVGRVATSVFGGKGYADSLEARAAAQIAAQEKEAVEAADRVQDGITMEDRKAIATAATGSDIKLSDGRTIRATEAAQTAARDNVMSIGSFKDRNAMIEHVINSGDSMTSAAKQRVIQAAYAKGDGDIYGKGFGDKILNKSIKTADDLKRSTLENAASGALQAEHLVQSAPSTQYISDAIYNAAASSDPATQKLANEADTFFVQAAKQARSSDSTNTKTVGKIDSIFKDHGA